MSANDSSALDATPPPVFGVVGSPFAAANSLSPVMFAAAFAACNITAYYVPLTIRERSVRKSLRSLARLGFAGVNVTTPYKAIAAEIADTRSEAVIASGVANTLTVDRNGHVHAEATDGQGLRAALAAHHIDVGGATVTLIGAGGVSSDIAITLAQAGVSRIGIWNRTVDRAHALAERVAAFSPTLTLEVFDKLPIGDEAHIVVCAVPAGSMREHVMDIVAGRSLVVDLAYQHDRLPTELIRAAQSRGVAVIDGRELLVRQGAAAFTHWMSQPAPVEVMMRAVS